jgi:hypothetical protein
VCVGLGFRMWLDYYAQREDAPADAARCRHCYGTPGQVTMLKTAFWSSASSLEVVRSNASLVAFFFAKFSAALSWGGGELPLTCAWAARAAVRAALAEGPLTLRVVKRPSSMVFPDSTTTSTLTIST